MDLARTIKVKIKRWVSAIWQNDGVWLQFRNASSFSISSLRVVIANEVYEFRNLMPGELTPRVHQPTSNLYFFAYIVTNSFKIYFEPSLTQLKRTVKSGDIVISIFIDSKDGRKASALMHPRIMSQLN